VQEAVVSASAGSAGMFGGGAVDAAAQVAAELEAASACAGDEMGISAEEGDAPVVLAQGVIDSEQIDDDVQLDAGVGDLEDDVQLVIDTDPADDVLDEASSAFDQAIIATTPSPVEGDASTLSSEGSEQMRAGLEALSRTKVEAALIERMGPEVIGLKDATKDELVGLEVTLGSTPEQAVDAAQRTEKAVAKGLSLLDNNKTQTSSTDIEILFSELANLVDNN
jgi:hypothetical protein